jgi:hypothetical protein
MTMQPSPNISPEEINLLRIACSMAWSDGELSPTEKELLLSHFSKLFSQDEKEERSLHQELQDYVSQNIHFEALEELIPKLQFEEDRELMLKLGYMVIRASRRDSIESSINPQEKVAYRRLVELLDLPVETIEKIEWAAERELQQHNGVVDAVASGLNRFFSRMR